MSLFVTFEGPEGSGKTTQISLLEQGLVEIGRSVLCTREPGGTVIGEQIRVILHSVDNQAMLPVTEALLYSAARAQHVQETIRPALLQDDIVISDRYAYSTLAYQGYGHGLDRQMLERLTAWVTGGLEPDLVIYLDLEVSEGLRRKKRAQQAGEGEWNRMDQLDVTFHRAVRDGYLRMAEQNRERWLIVDAMQSIEAVRREIWTRIQDLL